MASSETIRILNIQRMSTEDGPGLRTTVFFKGCPLRCEWCHNPESLSYSLEKEWIETSCIRCLICLKHCPEGALSLVDGQIIINRNLCSQCRKCVVNCPTEAMKALGVDKDVDWLFQDLIKDKAYFGTSGGVTFSGGEALIQAKAAAVLAEKLKSAGIKVAIDTCGHVPYHHFEMLLPHVEMFLYDLKLIDSKQHEALTKEPNQLILDNLIRLNQAKKTIWIRTPIIPGATDNETNITGIASFIKENQICFERWELCAFNNLGKDKYRRLGIPWRYDEAKLMEKKTMEQLTMAARKVFGDEERRIIWTGATRLEEN